MSADSASSPSASDEDGLALLMARYCGGEIAAFHQLYAAVAPRILSYLTGLMGDRPTAEDLLQQTFMKLHEARPAYVKGANPVPWLYTIAHRTCLDEMRRRKRARVRISKDGTLPYEPSVDITGVSEAHPPVDEAAIARGLAALATLPTPLRQAVLLTKIHGHSSAQAASIAGTTVGAIKVRAHRGYQALRRKLAGSTGEPNPAVGTP
jgi:RNA polymerase sigma factor (sigma-70 family)